MPKIGKCEFLGPPKFLGGPEFTQISTINMNEFITKRRNILIQCHGNYMELKIFNYMLEIDIIRISSQNLLGVLRGAF